MTSSPRCWSISDSRRLTGRQIDDDERERGRGEHDRRDERGQPPAKAAGEARLRSSSADGSASNRYPTVRPSRSAPAVAAAQLPAQVADVDVDDVRPRVVLVSPDRSQDLLAREHAGRCGASGSSSSSNSVLESRTGSPARRTSRLSRSTRCRPPRASSSLAPSDAQLRADSGGELAQRERLGEVVDQPRIEARDPVVDLAAGGQRDHRQARLDVLDRGEHLACRRVRAASCRARRGRRAR